jgi:hypothetical protein
MGVAAIVVVVAAIAAISLFRGETSGSEAPSNVRIVQSDATGEQWIRWDDNSSDEAGYRGSVRLLNDAGEVIAVSDFNTPPPGEAQTPATSFEPRYIDDGACYEGRVNVEAVMRDGSTLAAPEATLHVCIEGGTPRYRPFVYTPEALTFPEFSPFLVQGTVQVAPTGQYSLSLEGSARTDYVLTTTRVYSEEGKLLHEAPMGTVPGSTTSIHIDAGEGLLPLDPQSMPGGRPPGIYDGCYRREFVIWTIEDGVLDGESRTPRLPVCYRN